MSIETQFKQIQMYDYPYTPERFASHLTEVMSAPDFRHEDLAYDIRTGLMGVILSGDQRLYTDERVYLSIAAMKEKFTFCLMHGMRDALTMFMLVDNIGLTGASARDVSKDPAKCLNYLIRNNKSLHGSYTAVTDTIGYCLMQDLPVSVVQSSLPAELLEKFVLITKRTDLLGSLEPKSRKHFLESDLSL